MEVEPGAIANGESVAGRDPLRVRVCLPLSAATRARACSASERGWLSSLSECRPGGLFDAVRPAMRTFVPGPDGPLPGRVRAVAAHVCPPRCPDPHSDRR
ncbi:hypothetical protein [Nocardiopsis ansamitocini]|uniref:Uncharacterized protein n=1 Tax=Nocardiopsis ansamitocini TaxID=1670832 RepID=A0A9W6PA90_9ACTN|nr:hypothetical protein [Nocardiopsis ansamitocini]GLU50489.1 hypothetical protein Nans01_48400 [Nocardiopsis ansamitocini]